ncbi:MAG: PAS domain S-box protein [Deltaproteobacteria bacterium]|nr:PAS domain S-box protein [Deltaproteobacteria bacterium]
MENPNHSLRESEERLRKIIEHNADGILVVNREGVVRFVNPAAESLWGRPARTLTGMDIGLPMVSDESTDVHILHASGTEVIASMRAVEIDWEGEPCFLISLRDVTERKRAEERIRHLNNVIQAIRNVNKLITREKDRDRLIRLACENLVATRGFNSAWIGLVGSSGAFVRCAEAGIGESFLPFKQRLEQGYFPWCAQEALAGSNVKVFEDPSEGCGDCPFAQAGCRRAAFSVRLENNGNVYGVLISSVPDAFAQDKEEQSLFQEVGQDIAFALSNIEAEQEKRKAEQALRDSEVRYRSLFQGASEGILIADVETRKYLFANPAICEMLGYTEAELTGMRVDDIHPREVLYQVISAFENRIGKEKVAVSQVPCLRKDGTVLYVDITSTPTVIDGTLCSVGFFTDTTEKRKAHDALKESEERFKSLFEYSPDAYYLHDLDGRFVDANRSTEELCGYSKEELIGKRSPELRLLPEDELEKAAEILGKNAQGLSTGPDELILNRKDGKQVRIEARTLPLTLSGQALVLGIARDITERRKLEDQLRQAQKMEAVGRLAGGIAHDFNNLLTVILGNAEVALMDCGADEPLREILDQILKAGDRAAALTRQLLAFSRKQLLQPTALNLNDMVRNMEKMLRRIIGEDVEVRNIVAQDLGQVEADEGQMEQVIANLVVNARDAMPQGGKLTIETANVDLDEYYAETHVDVAPGPYVMLSVSDTGIGMSREIQAKIFEPFFTTKEMGKGTGLGLSTVYGIVKQSNGNIWVYSEVGRGTTFKIYLPRIDKECRHVDEARLLTESFEGFETILVVEDDVQVKNLTLKVLLGYGYTVLGAADGPEALQISAAHEGKIHLLVTDVVMPGMSGKVLADQMKVQQPKMKTLFMSGYTDNAIVHHGVLEGGSAFLQKPFAPKVLARKVREVLDT